MATIVERLAIVETQIKNLQKINWTLTAVIAAQIGWEVVPLIIGILL